MTTVARAVLTKANATQANDPGRIWMSRTRLKTAKSAGRSRSRPPERPAQRPSKCPGRMRPTGTVVVLRVLLTLVAKARDQLVLGHRGATLDPDLLGPLLQLLKGPLLVGSGHPAAAARRLGRPGPHLRPGRLDLHPGRLDPDLAVLAGLGAVGQDAAGALGCLDGTLGRPADAGAGRLDPAAGAAGTVDRLPGGGAASDGADQVAAAPGHAVAR